MVQVRRSLLAGRGEGTRLPARGDQRGIPQDAAGCRQVLRRGRIVSTHANIKLTFFLVFFQQGCGSVSGSGLDPDSIGLVDPDPDPGGQK